VEPSEPVIANWWRQGMMGGAKAHWDCVSEFIHQDWSEDLKKISVPVLAMNGDADQVVPHDTSGPRAVKPTSSTPTCWRSSSPDRVRRSGRSRGG
jgi:non-heme chloroperoxidase